MTLRSRPARPRPAGSEHGSARSDLLGLGARLGFGGAEESLGLFRAIAKRHGAITLEERIEAGMSADSIRRELADSIGIELPRSGI